MPQEKVLGIVSVSLADEWNSGTQYEKLNIVRHDYAIYGAKKANLNVEPGVAQNWQESWMYLLRDAEGEVVIPTGIYPQMTVGTAQALNKLSITIQPTQWEDNAVTLTTDGYPGLANLTANSFVLLYADKSSELTFLTCGIDTVSQSAGSITLVCTTTPSQAVSGTLIFM